MYIPDRTGTYYVRFEPRILQQEVQPSLLCGLSTLFHSFLGIFRLLVQPRNVVLSA
jgi:hypothetical protein